MSKKIKIQNFFILPQCPVNTNSKKFLEIFFSQAKRERKKGGGDTKTNSPLCIFKYPCRKWNYKNFYLSLFINYVH